MAKQEGTTATRRVPPCDEGRDVDLSDAKSRFHGLRWVRLMAVFGSEGVWQMDGTEGLLEDLPVPAALRARIEAWQAQYDDHDDMDADAPALDAERFGAEGLALAKAVKAALPDWTVVYHDEARSARGLPRPDCEVEIPPQRPG